MAGVSISDRFKAAVAAGFNPGEALTMVAISLKECAACDLSSVNKSGDVGLFQINSQNWGSDNFQTSVYGDLSNIYNNARAAFAIYSGAGGGQAGFRRWCTYPGGCNVNGGPNQYTPAELQSVIQSVAQTLATAGGGDSGGIPDPGTGGSGGNSGGSSGGGSGGGSSGGGSSPGGGSFGGDVVSSFVGEFSGPVVLGVGITAVFLGFMMWKGGDTVKVVNQGVKTGARVAELMP